MPPKRSVTEQVYFGVVSDGTCHCVRPLNGSASIYPPEPDATTTYEEYFRPFEPMSFPVEFSDESIIRNLVGEVGGNDGFGLFFETHRVDMKVPMRVRDMRRRKKGNRGNRSIGLVVYNVRKAYPNVRLMRKDVRSIAID